MFIAATRHKAAFLAEYKADANAVPTGSLPIALRIGATKPDWRTPDEGVALDRLEGHGGAGQLGIARPRRLRRRGLVHEDDRVRRRAAGETTLSLGRISNTAEVWVNGLSVAQNFTRRRPPRRRGARRRPWRRWPRCGAGSRCAAGGRTRQPALRAAAGTLKPGANTITVRITNNRNDGGFLGTPDTMFVAGRRDADPAGRHLEVPRRAAEQRRSAVHQAGRAAPLTWRSPIPPAPATATLPEPARRAAPDVVIAPQRQVRSKCSSTRPS